MIIRLSQPLYIHELGQRANQEDNIYPNDNLATPEDHIFMVCDGMGGHEFGEVASSTVCESLSEWLKNNWSPQEPLDSLTFTTGLKAAYEALDAKDNPEVEKKMGTTLAFVALHSGGATVAHIGDSRVYLIRPKTGEIIFKTRDHSLVNDLIRLGEMTEEEAKTATNKNVITRAMQPHQARRCKADVAMLDDIQPGDYFYICSDGMLEVMEDEEIISIFSNPNITDEIKKNVLIQNTIENRDNHSAYIIPVYDVEETISQSASLTQESILPEEKNLEHPVIKEVQPVKEEQLIKEEPVVKEKQTVRKEPADKQEPTVKLEPNNSKPAITEQHQNETAPELAKVQDMVKKTNQLMKRVIFFAILIILLISLGFAYAFYAATNKGQGPDPEKKDSVLTEETVKPATPTVASPRKAKVQKDEKTEEKTENNSETQVSQENVQGQESKTVPTIKESAEAKEETADTLKYA